MTDNVLRETNKCRLKIFKEVTEMQLDTNHFSEKYSWDDLGVNPDFNIRPVHCI